ncbi:MAG TPA: hypothetical protein VIL21_06405 [Solirubrobacterales bacterium]
MATRDRIIHLTPDSYERLEREAGRRGVEPDALAAELLAAELGPTEFDWDGTLSELAAIRSRVHGNVDAVALVREGRSELEHRGF